MGSPEWAQMHLPQEMGVCGKGQGDANGRKMKGKNDGLAFLRKTDIYSLCFLTRCNVTRRLTYSLLYTLS